MAQNVGKLQTIYDLECLCSETYLICVPAVINSNVSGFCNNLATFRLFCVVIG